VNVDRSGFFSPDTSLFAIAAVEDGRIHTSVRPVPSLHLLFFAGTQTLLF